MTEYFTADNVARSTTLLLASTGMIVGIRSFTSPLASAQTFGLPQSPALPPNQFILVYGGRTFAGSLAILALAYQRDWKAVGTTMLCGVVTAASDAFLCFKHGVRDAAIGHCVTTVMTAGLGAWFLWG